MSKHLKPPLALAAALAASSLFAGASPASASANIKEMSFSTESAYNQVIHVISTDRKKWNKIKSGSAGFWGQMKVDTKWPGYVFAVGVFLGQCSGQSCHSFPDIYAKKNIFVRDYLKSKNFAFNPAIIPVSNGGIPVVPYGNQIIAKCNEKLSADGPTERHDFNFEMTATLAANTGKTLNLNNAVHEVGPDSVGPIDHWRYGKFTVKVVCDPVAKPASNDIAAEEPDFKVKDLKLFLSTFSHAVTKPTSTKTCKKGRILLRAKTTRAGPVKLKLWTRIGDGPITPEVIDAWSSFKGPGLFQAEVKKWVSVSKTSLLTAKVEQIVAGPFGLHDGWKNLKLKCITGASDDLASPDAPAPDQGHVIPAKITGKLKIEDTRPGSTRRRFARVLFDIFSNRPNNGGYKLTCSNGRTWTGTINMIKTAPDKYRGSLKRVFRVRKTGTIGCALRSTEKSPNPLLAIANRYFKVGKTKPVVSGPDELTNGNKPTHNTPRPNRPQITANPKISCAFGRVRRGVCICPPGRIKVHAGKNAWRCIKRTARPGKLTPHSRPNTRVFRPDSRPSRRHIQRQRAPRRLQRQSLRRR